VSNQNFNVVLIIPTGLGASVGGHAGDAGSVARLMASVCDKFITHPNVVNASDINEMTDNTLYVEGYLLSQYLSGHIGLEEVRQNRVLVIIDGRADEQYISAAINAVNAARSSYGFNCPEIVIENRFPIMRSTYSENGRALGFIRELNHIDYILRNRAGQYDAVAITSLIEVDRDVRDKYYKEGGVNPWGGVEAMLTHSLSSLFSVPCAHAPMMESVEVETLDYGVIDPRDAAEIVSLTYLQSVLKGLNRAPKFDLNHYDSPSCLVIPRRCLGWPQFAASQNNIPIIAVDDDLEVDGIDSSKYFNVIHAENYLEAVGLVSALRSGICVDSLRRPLEKVKVTRKDK
jgi:hypothetical protein